MKIGAIGLLNLNRTQSKKNLTGDMQNSFVKAASSPIYDGKISYPVTFTAFGKNPIPKDMNLLKGIDLPCFYCGQKMIPKRVYDHLGWISEPSERSLSSFLDVVRAHMGGFNVKEKHVIKELTELGKKEPNISWRKAFETISFKPTANLAKYSYRKISAEDYSSETMKIIKKYEDKLVPVKKAVFREMELYQKKHPEASLLQILLALRPKHLATLIRKQEKILSNIDYEANRLSKEKRRDIKKVTDEARKLIQSENTGDAFRRRIFKDKIREVLEGVQDEGVLRNIERELQSMPSSTNSVDAFIVKYSGPVNTSSYERRPLEERILEDEKPAYEKIKQLVAQEGKEFDLNSYVTENYEKHRVSLFESRNKMVDELRNRVEAYTKSFRATIAKQVINTREDLLNPELDATDVRLRLLNNLRKLKPIVHDNYLNQIIMKASELPYPKNDMNALIAKRRNDIFLVSANEKAGKTKETYRIEQFVKKEEQEIFSEIKKQYALSEGIYANRPEGMSLQQFIAQKGDDFDKSVLEKQNKILEEINLLTEKIADKYKAEVEENISGLYDINTIHSTGSIMGIPPLNTVLNPTITKITSLIDQSSYGVDALVCELVNTKKEIEKAKVEVIYRTDREIGQSLIVDSIESIEHLKPKSKWIMAENGQDEVGNLVMAHRYCNMERENMPQAEYFKLHPDYLKNNNPQKQMNAIIKGINEGDIKGLDSYPKMVKETCINQSKDSKTGESKVVLDISKLDLKLAKQNINKKRVEKVAAKKKKIDGNNSGKILTPEEIIKARKGAEADKRNKAKIKSLLQNVKQQQQKYLYPKKKTSKKNDSGELI